MHVSFSPLTCENRAGSAGLWGSHMSPSNASQAPARRHAEARHTRGPEELTGHTAGKWQCHRAVPGAPGPCAGPAVGRVEDA